MSLLDLLCPARCEGCGSPGALACGRCLLPLSAEPREHRPTPCPPGLPPLWAVASYEGSVRELLLGFKERGAAGLADALARPLAVAVRAASPAPGGPVVVVPVPSARTSVRRRGDDVVALLAYRTARALRRDGTDSRVVPALVHRRRVADSAGLSAVQRSVNLREAFGVPPRLAMVLRPHFVVVIDDLVTTGATLCEATRALAAERVAVAGAAVVAATRRRA